MGLHHHVRVSVDGKKIRSAGGDAYRWVTNDMKNAPEVFIRDHICHVPKDDQAHTITCTCVRRHQNHVNRTITRYIAFAVQNLNGNPVFSKMVDAELDLNLSRTSPAYKYFHKLTVLEVIHILRRHNNGLPIPETLMAKCVQCGNEDGGTA